MFGMLQVLVESEWKTVVVKSKRDSLGSQVSHCSQGDRQQEMKTVTVRACSYGKKFSRLARKHFDKFTSEISPSYENSMKSYLAFI